MSTRFTHCGWEDDESDDTFARPGERKSLIFIRAVGDDGYPDDEVACIVHRHVGDLNPDAPGVAAKEAMADRIVAALNGAGPVSVGDDLAAAVGLPLVRWGNGVSPDVWVCEECGCVFIPDFIGAEPGHVYPDRFEAAGQGPPHGDCRCHHLPRHSPIAPPINEQEATDG